MSAVQPTAPPSLSDAVRPPTSYPHRSGVIASEPMEVRRLERVVARHPKLRLVFAATPAELAAAVGHVRSIPSPLGVDLAVVSLSSMEPPVLEWFDQWRQLLTPRLGFIAITPPCSVGVTCRLAALGVRHHLLAPVDSAVLAKRLTASLPPAPVLRPRKQREVDLVLATALSLAPPADGTLPAGYSASTLAAVIEALARLGRVTAAEVAAEVGLSRVSVRRYLELAERRGEVVASCDYGARGRPAKKWERLTVE